VLLLAVVIIALATLFLLTALALGAAGELSHPYRVALVILATLIIGAALLYEYGRAG
jgi:hypothetical protein